MLLVNQNPKKGHFSTELCHAILQYARKIEPSPK